MPPKYLCSALSPLKQHYAAKDLILGPVPWELSHPVNILPWVRIEAKRKRRWIVFEIVRVVGRIARLVALVTALVQFE